MSKNIRIVATITRAGRQDGSRVSVQLPIFGATWAETLEGACMTALNVVDPHDCALVVSIGATDDSGDYLGMVAERSAPYLPAKVTWSRDWQAT